MSYDRWSPTTGMSSSRQAICQTFVHTFSTSTRWNSAVVYRSTGTSASLGGIGENHRKTSGTSRPVLRVSASSSSWYVRVGGTE